MNSAQGSGQGDPHEGRHGAGHDPASVRQRLASRRIGVSGNIARAFLESKLTPLLVTASLFLGAFAVLVTPREEEPQIKVPMIDVFVGLPGASAQEVERRVITPLEKALHEIDNVEYVYSTSQPSGGMIIVRFLVGSDPDQAVVRVQAKVAEVAPELPAGSVAPLVVPRSIDDVPVLAYTLWSEHATPLELRQAAQEIKAELSRHPRVAQVTILGGQQRVVSVHFDRDRLASHGVSLLEVYQALGALNWRLPAGSFATADDEVSVDVGSFFRSAGEVAGAVIAVRGGQPVYLRDVAEVTDGPDEASDYVWMIAGAAGAEKDLPAGLDVPAVTLAVSKKPGTNAVDLVTDLDQRIDALRAHALPTDLHVTKTRDYGFTADEKSSELIKHLWIATFAVVLLMALALGRREAVVVAVAVPTTLALTLASSYLFGYTLNRVTLFALIFAIGILVDDAIVVVEN
ncbi:MAG: efflux RND transporter permease subunit, partial [Acidobacteria bacterium]|nr:efflux RND transporter permease subunit [Acidobacteriota bacterium]